MALARKNSKSNGSSRKQTKGKSFVLCVRNEGYPASLERRKLYPVIRDASAAKRATTVKNVDASVIRSFSQKYLFAHS